MSLRPFRRLTAHSPEGDRFHVLTPILVANRGEIACRIIRTIKSLGLTAVAVYADDDAGAVHVGLADQAVALGDGSVASTYLDIDKILDAASSTGARAVHPGYGFLSENSDFARRCAAEGIVFIGPAPECIEAMGDKIAARNLMMAAGVPVAPGSIDPLRDEEAAVAEAGRIGYPVMVKAARGGGGIGMMVARDPAELRRAFVTAQARGAASFGAADVLIERYVSSARHIEVQIFGLADGTVIALGERDCSVQRRHQKLAEETPSPFLRPDERAQLFEASVRAATAVGYHGAGTVEWLFDVAHRDFMFLEMNTRLQVEHTVTELVTGTDLVAAQIRVASGEPVDTTGWDSPLGHALEMRICAEDPIKFLPRTGTITRWSATLDGQMRLDSGYKAGDHVGPRYDSLLAKLCVWALSRDEMLECARRAVDGLMIDGLTTNQEFFRELLEWPAFVTGDYDTSVVERMRAETSGGQTT